MDDPSQPPALMPIIITTLHYYRTPQPPAMMPIIIITQRCYLAPQPPAMVSIILITQRYYRTISLKMRTPIRGQQLPFSPTMLPLKVVLLLKAQINRKRRLANEMYSSMKQIKTMIHQSYVYLQNTVFIYLTTNTNYLYSLLR